ncbi:MAG: hypothetical protein JWN79_3468 [Gemmatimonadetes bacterium]|jgi:hypothetical protein|nr:hypothetical protein [Gemmatimonadota bacterium]
MSRVIAAAWAACLSLALIAGPRAATAQSWNDARSRALAESATVRRVRQLADTGLKDYRAVAHGYVTFLAQLGEGLAEPPKVVKADELVNEIYWLAPNLSKQRIVGRRDTLLLPTDISYHRDHLGIVQNNFPAIIRLGDGDEVRDVPHPLSAAGLAAYDFAITDSLPLQLPGRTIVLYEVKVRPKDDRQPRIVGAVYIDRDDAQVVRMAFNFTRAAFLDNALEDLFVVIENGLIGARFWLPRRQEIEIRRGGTWLDYPVRGIIRGRWEIGDYAVNTGLTPAFFNGAEIVVAPRAVQDTFHFQGRILDSLPPDVRAVTDADIQKVREEARALVRAQALQRPQRFLLSASGASDFVRVDRAEGFAVGGGVATRFGGGADAAARARYGVDDRTAKASVQLGWQSPRAGVRLFAMRDYREAGDIRERSGLVNSIAAQELGADATDPYGVQAVGAGLDAAGLFGARWRFDLSLERQHALDLRARPQAGAYPRMLPATPLRAVRGALVVDRPTSLSLFGTEVRATGELRVSRLTTDDASAPIASTVARTFLALNVERPFERGRLVLRTSGGVVGGTGAVPAQELLYAGGPVSAPGYAFHSFASRAQVTQLAEWRLGIPAPAILLGRFGRVPGRATLAPFIQATFARPALDVDVAHPAGLYPSAGVALQPFFDLLRLQVARGLRHGEWQFNVDVSREFWGIL